MMDHTPTGTTSEDAEPAIERLIGRIIDGEATEDDRIRFEKRADVEPVLWRRLAQSQEDRELLAEQVHREIAGVDEVELPAAHEVARRSAPSLAWSGWAAAIVLAAVWIVTTTISRPAEPLVARPAISHGSVLTPEEHLKSYMSAQYVLGELDPMLLQAEEMSDGRIALRFLRRIEEVVFLDATQQLPPAAGDGTLLMSPDELREQSQPIEEPAPGG